MWAATVFNPQPIIANSLTNRTNTKTLKITATASISNFPLASRIMVRNVVSNYDGESGTLGENCNLDSFFLSSADLPYSTSESNLQKEFSNFGQIAEVKLVKDEYTKSSRGFAFIQYTSQNDAMLALENMDHQVFDGRLIYVEIAKPGKDILGRRPRTSGPPKEPKKLHFQEQDEVADCWY